jgi:hypothetical protein
MTIPDDYKPSASAIKNFFAADLKSTEFISEYRALTTEDKRQLSYGIESGTLTY